MSARQNAEENTSDAGSEFLPETQGSEVLGKDALLREAAAATWGAHVHWARARVGTMRCSSCCLH